MPVTYEIRGAAPPTPGTPSRPGRLVATSDLHIRHPENRKIADSLWPESEHDWLLVAGDIGELVSDIEWTLRTLSERFAKVIWVPGNHELWTAPDDPIPLRGDAKYRHLVELCRGLGVVTPEDPYPVWEGEGGPAVIAPLFLLYDYSFRPPARTPRNRPSRSRRRPVSSAPTSSCSTPTRIPAGRRGAGPGSRRPSAYWPRSRPSCPPS